MKKLLAGVFIGMCVPLVAGYLFVILGGMPVATKGDPPAHRTISREKWTRCGDR